MPASRWPSACALVAANLIPVYGVLQLHWPVFSLLALFWFEVVIIGMVTVLSMLYAPVSGLYSRIGKLIAWPFFFVGFAIPALLYGIALAAIFSPDAANAQSYGLLGLSRVVPPPDIGMNIPIVVLATVLVLLEAVGDGWFAPLAIGSLAASHLVAFFRHYGDRGELRASGAGARSFKPFGWLVLMHTIVIAGGAAALSGDSPVWAPLLIIAVKTAVDLAAHLRQWSHDDPAALPTG